MTKHSYTFGDVRCSQKMVMFDENIIDYVSEKTG